ncbi:MAG: RecQ family ATP-dependent DNA helicase [Acidobacteria bacterium]|nr:RecQ family ATP-dependent DNA helicase [Acidobacteriota bacterium]MCB9399012.1 RecQ family ATP-dependent DNA helicase [Acidobacteriota bacterium]
MENEAQQLTDILSQRFGFATFRPGQQEIIQTLMREHCVVCIQPTGYGKSLLYQLPTVLLPGMTVVISPLLALMRDQIRHLNQRFAIPAASINSDQTEEENDQAMAQAESGQLKILFIAPERLENLTVFAFLQRLPVDLLVIDEAHCISTWGHDFRPAYRQILNAVHTMTAKNQGLRLLALTATANHKTEADIVAQLSEKRSVQIMRSSMDRPNLALAIRPVQGLGEKLAFLLDHLRGFQGCALLYCATREQTELVASYLSQNGLSVTAYHAGFLSDQKRALQERFISGQAPIIAATNALGMGIDKPDIRLIVHVDVPGSITAYYQEVGRAGRDGQPAQGLLLYDPADRKVQDYFIQNAQPNPNDFKILLQALKPDNDGNFPRLNDLKTRTGLHPTRVTVVLAELQEQGFIEKVLQGRNQVYRPLNPKKELDLSRYRQQLEVRTQELNAMLAYAEGQSGCLMQALRRALGDDRASPCNQCSICDPSAWQAQHQPIDATKAWDWLTTRPIPIAASKYPPMAEGASVLSAELGSPAFATFMRNRADRPGLTAPAQIESALLDWIIARAKTLTWRQKIGAVVPLPSRTWLQREHLAQALAEALGVPCFPDLLYWSSPPEQRQGQLHNNDQRRANVKERMAIDGRLQLPRDHAVLLLDDYIGSGATLREAGRVLTKQAHFDGPIIPFTVARVRWRLGAPGMV